MTIRNRFDIEALHRVGQVVAETLELMTAAMEPGIETREPRPSPKPGPDASSTRSAGLAQYEHTLIVTDGEPIITTRLGA